MSKFSEILRKERTTKRLLLRNLSDLTNLSIGYLSDLEQERRQPPTDLNLIHKLEAALEITDGRLRKAAMHERQVLPPEIVENYFQRPRMQEAFFRLGEMTDHEIETFLHKGRSE